MILEVCCGIVEMVTTLQQSLRWNAPNVQARAAETAPHLDAGRLEAHLTGLDGSHVPTRASTCDGDR